LVREEKKKKKMTIAGGMFGAKKCRGKSGGKDKPGSTAEGASREQDPRTLTARRTESRWKPPEKFPGAGVKKDEGENVSLIKDDGLTIHQPAAK